MDARGEHVIPPNQFPSSVDSHAPPSVLPLRDAHADPPFDVADSFVRLQVYFQSWQRFYRLAKGSRIHGDEKGRGLAAGPDTLECYLVCKIAKLHGQLVVLHSQRRSVQYYDISENHSSSSSSDWAIPFHFGDPAEDGPSLDVTHAFDPETLREIEMSSPRDEVSLDHMD